jgi:hypothetical protein
MRSDFPAATKRRLAQRVGWRCSNPACRTLTSGPTLGPSGTVNLGVAAHIAAASTGGPRFNHQLTIGGRRSLDNGIWLCQTCAHLIDSEVSEYPETVLRAWKLDSEELARCELGRHRSISTIVQPIRYSAIGLAPQCQWMQIRRHSVCPGLVIDFGFHEVPRTTPSTQHTVVDPILDFTIINDSPQLGTVSAFGIELVAATNKLKGVPRPYRLRSFDVEVLRLERLVIGHPQFVTLRDPIVVPPSGVLRHHLWLADFRQAVVFNESLVRIVTIFNDAEYRSRAIYLGCY